MLYETFFIYLEGWWLWVCQKCWTIPFLFFFFFKLSPSLSPPALCLPSTLIHTCSAQPIKHTWPSLAHHPTVSRLWSDLEVPSLPAREHWVLRSNFFSFFFFWITFSHSDCFILHSQASLPTNLFTTKPNPSVSFTSLDSSAVFSPWTDSTFVIPFLFQLNFVPC